MEAKRKGIIIFTLVLICSYVLLLNQIDEYTITKDEVRKGLQPLNIVLQDHFEIIHNDVSGMPDRIQVTKLRISNRDKQAIISSIQTAKNRKLYKSTADVINDTTYTKDEISNKIFPEFYERQVYRIVDNIPTRIILTLSPNSHDVTYQRVEDK